MKKTGQNTMKKRSKNQIDLKICLKIEKKCGRKINKKNLCCSIKIDQFSILFSNKLFLAQSIGPFFSWKIRWKKIDVL